MADDASFGFTGRYLEVDLTARHLRSRPLTDELLDHLGGLGTATLLFYDRYRRGIEAFDEDNPLVVFTGSLTGTNVPTAARTAVVSMSPQTGGLGMSNFGGFWGSALKRAGYDGIVVHGRSDRLVYLDIVDAEVVLRDAEFMRGLDAWEVRDRLVERSADESQRVLAIGPAGEHRVRYAAITVDYFNSGSRCGLGAVLGAKGLKAIAVRGSGGVRVHDPEGLQQLVDSNLEMARTASNPFGLDAFNYVEGLKERGAFGYRNFADEPPPACDTSGLAAEEASRLIAGSPSYRKSGRSCQSCPYGCYLSVELTEGRHAGLNNAGMAPALLVCWSGKCEINDYPGIWKCEEVCNRLGLDAFSTATVISYVLDLFDKGVIDARDTDGLALGWGDEAGILELLERIAHGRGPFARLVGQGASAVARAYGCAFVPTVKGMEMFGVDPRTSPLPWVIGDIVSLRGGDNLTNTHNMHFLLHPHTPEQEARIIEEIRIPRRIKRRIFSSSLSPRDPEALAELLIWGERQTMLLNCLGVCILEHLPLNFRTGFDHYAAVLRAATGRQVDATRLVHTCDRLINLHKTIMHDAGYGIEDDTWPSRFFDESIRDGPHKGRVVDRELVRSTVERYYERRGWSPQTGAPTAATLSLLGLEDVVDER